jgi:nitronate monooxygenase
MTGSHQSTAQRVIALRNLLRLPLVVAPMFLVSSPRLVAAACRAGVIGAIPSLNAREPEKLGSWLEEISTELSLPNSQPWPVAPYALNVLTHPSNVRLPHDIDAIAQHKPPIVIASVGRPEPVIEVVHRYGGLVFSDVVSLRHAHRAAQAGVDGLVLLCAGAGGQTGRLNPFAFVEAVRHFYSGMIAVAGGITTGHQVRALELIGADLAYSGTPFIATPESFASAEYKQALISSGIDDVWDTDAISGIPANVLRQTLESLGLSPEGRWVRSTSKSYDWASIRWRPDLFSAGHGVDAVQTERPCASVIEQIAQEYAADPTTPTQRGVALN